MRITNLRDRWVLVTGAGSGIGRATALAFARAGANLVIVDINGGPLAPVRDEITGRGRRCVAATADVSDAAQMRGLADQVHAEIEAVDILVNNAGIAYLGPFGDTPPEAWRRILEINVMGVVHGCREFLPRMQHGGRTRWVVNVASLAGLMPAPNMSAYAASKAAVVAISEALALEISLAGHTIGVSAVCPGIVNTAIVQASGSNIAKSVSSEQLAKLQAYYAANGVEPEVVAEAIVAAVRTGRDLVLVGKFARPIYHLKRLSRTLTQKLMLRDARRAGYC